ncbi:MAG: CDP-diacylglycerol--glycerol-3-phosphate 3-phosphatidyltransferase [Melioribacteraceae bacterium]|nr:MAG: CDP-diacylglycerol--glycerol-3-phosphate 3-phosphatidyltransferase [Melioribacteraceae bacterium]
MIYPNQLTIARIILTPVFFYLFLADDVLLKQISIVVFVLAALTDWYDGWLARKFNYITQWGKFLDPLADKILTSAAFIAFSLIGMFPMWMVVIIIVRDFVITGLRLYADYTDISFSTSKAAKIKTFVQMAFLYYTLTIYTFSLIDSLAENYSGVFEILLHPEIIYYSMLGITLFTLWTGIRYFTKNYHSLKNHFGINAK